MSYCIDICVICLKKSNNLTIISLQGTNETSFEDKLKYFLPEFVVKSNIPKYVCAKCQRNLSKVYEFKQKCLLNMTTYEKYAQQITTKDGSFKYLSVVIRSDFVGQKAEISDENNYETILEPKKEIIDDEESALNKEIELLLREIKEKNWESDDTSSKNENHKLRYSKPHKKSYTCEVCKKSFSKLTYFKEHLLIHAGEKPFTCEVCNESFKHFQHLKQHRSIHTGVKPFTCEVCNKSFRQLWNLKQHRLLHTNNKPYICEVCNESFRRLYTLKKHKLVHTGEKPYTCEVCNESFRSLSNLKRHTSGCSPNKSFACEVCNKAFQQLKTLKKHKLLHPKTYTCKVCNEAFKQSNNLKRHLFVHTGEKPFTCNICNTSFTTKQNLQRHLRIHSKYKFKSNKLS